jgi:hypothetical protein
MIYTVYKTTNSINGKIYIGVHKTSNPNDTYLGSGIALQNAIKKHGRSNFFKTILFSFSTIKEAYKKEHELVSSDFVKDKMNYNLAPGGSISPDYSDERKLLYSKRLSGPNHPMWGKKASIESNLKRSKTQTGKQRDPMASIKSAMTRKLHKIPSFWKGKTQSADSNAKRSESHKNLSKITCLYCQAIISPQNAKRWHFENCKLNPESIRYDSLTHPVV